MSLYLKGTDVRRPRDLPRAAAPVLFGLFNIASGITGYNNTRFHVVAYTEAARVMPLDDWAIGFTILGALILTGAFHRRLAWLSAMVALFWWFLWCDLIGQTVGQPGVTPRAVVTTGGIAVLHLLLMPYRRRRSR